jgi:hypothetical protein
MFSWSQTIGKLSFHSKRIKAFAKLSRYLNDTVAVKAVIDLKQSSAHDLYSYAMRVFPILKACVNSAKP